MTADRTLARTDPDWGLYVSDFPAVPPLVDEWVSMRLHVRTTARVKVEQQAGNQGPLVWVAFGPHAQLFIPRDIAARLRDLLDVLFSAGVSEGAPTPASVSGSSPSQLTAPAEPSTATECER